MPEPQLEFVPVGGASGARAAVGGPTGASPQLEQLIAEAVAEAQRRGASATHLPVQMRVGNTPVLALTPAETGCV